MQYLQLRTLDSYYSELKEIYKTAKMILTDSISIKRKIGSILNVVFNKPGLPRYEHKRVQKEL